MHLKILLLAIALGQAALTARTVSIRLLVTSDLHGYIYPYDYFTAESANRGLAKIATLIASERATAPNLLLIDCGDTIQGSALESTYQSSFAAGKTAQPDPMMLAMNALGYSAMTLGNHELNYGLANLENARKFAKFPWLSANTKAEQGANVTPFQSYVIKEVDGVKIAIIGITTPSIPLWEKPENYRGYKFLPGEEAARAAVERVKTKHSPDVIIIASHSGLDRDLSTGKVFANSVPGENMVYQLATKVPDVDAIVFGHTHRSLANESIGNVMLLQPLNWGGSLGRLEITLEGEKGKWKVVSKKSALLPVKEAIQADPKILALAKPYHEAAEKELNVAVAVAPVAMDAAASRFKDTALIDAIQEVQMFYGKADVSFASSFNPNLKIEKGPMTVRQLAALYVYDNELYAIEGDGKMVKDALENAARYFDPCPPPQGCQGKPLVSKSLLGFNYDMAQGVKYEIDPSRPVGERILNLRYKGQPLRPDQPLRIAVNNYRYGGSAGYEAFRGAKILWQSKRPIRDLMVEYFTRKKQLPAKPDDNWRVILK